MTLAELLNQIEAYRPNAERLDAEMPGPTLPAMQIAKRQAQDQIASLRTQYQKEALSRVSLVLVSNQQDPSKVEKLLHKASLEPNVVAVEAAGFYSSLAVGLLGSIGREGSYLPTQCAALSGMLSQEAKKLDFHDVNPIQYKVQMIVNTYQSALSLVRDSVRQSNGDRLNTTFITNRILQEAENIKFTGDTLVVVLHGVDPSEVLAFKGAFPNNTVLDLREVEKIDSKFIATALNLSSPPETPATVVATAPQVKTEVKQKKEKEA